MQLELQTVQPEYLLLLGNVALQAITGRSGIMSKRGTAQNIGGRTVFATIHPAAVLRNPALESTFKADIQAFKRLVNGDNEKPKTDVKLIRSSKSLRVFCDLVVKVDTPIAFDVETEQADGSGGLRWWEPGGKIITAAFSWEPGTSYVIALEHPEAQWDISIDQVYEALNIVLKDKEMIGHNVKFDMHWMRAKKVYLKAKFDTFLAAHLLDENRSNGLKPLSRTFLGADLYESGISWGDTPLAKMAIYNAKDSDYTLRLYHILREELKKKPRLARLFKFLVMPACNMFTVIEENGFPVDTDRLIDRHREILRHIDRVTTELLSYCPEEDRVGANFRSPLFLGWYFFEHLELPILEVGAKSGRPSTKESVLLKLKDKHPSVKLLMELRKWQKYESTYTRNWIQRLRGAKRARLFTMYNLGGTVTGRLSSDMQQVPRDTMIRSIIGSRKGWTFIEADFAQIELRIAAMVSRDEELTRAFRTGTDPHLDTAVSILRKPPSQITKEERKMAKAVNFGFLYGMGARKFQVYADEKYGTKVTPEEAQAYRKAFFELYKALPAWHNRQRRLVRADGYVTSPIGRIRHLDSINSSEDFVQGEAEREAINAPVQGLASDFTVLSMVLLLEKLDLSKARIIGNVHDSILLEAKDEYAEEAAALVKETMENLPIYRLFGYRTTVPIEADVTSGTHWGETK
jgi:DNA polymerase-1